MSTEPGNGTGTAKTVKEMLIEHDGRFDDIRREFKEVRNEIVSLKIWLARAAGAITVLIFLLNVPSFVGWIERLIGRLP
jgi:hypothetical protein